MQKEKLNMASSEFELTFIIISLFIILVKLTHIIVRKLDMPDVLGELLLGFILGPTALGIFYLNRENSSSSLSLVLHLTTDQLVLTSNIVRFISEFAVLLLLFKVGTEVNISDLRKIKNKALSISIGGIVFPFIFGLVFTLIIANVIGINIQGGDFTSLDIAVLVGLILTATSIGISLRIFLDMGIIRSKVSQTVVGAAVFDDILSVTFLSLMFTYMVNNEHLNIGAIGLILLKIVLYFVLSFILFKYFIPKFKIYTHQFKDRSIPVFASIAFMLIMAVLAQIMNLTPIIGAFVAGVIIGNEDDYLDLESDFESITTWIIPFFFLSIGLQIDAKTLISPIILLLAIALTIISMAAKMIGGAGGAKLSGFDWNESKVIGLAMASRGEVTLIFATQAYLLGFISYDLYGIIILSVVITILVSVPILKKQISKNLLAENPDKEILKFNGDANKLGDDELKIKDKSLDRSISL